MEKIKLKNLGYSDYFENSYRSIDHQDLLPARIIAEHKGLYVLRNETHEFSAKIEYSHSLAPVNHYRTGYSTGIGKAFFLSFSGLE